MLISPNTKGGKKISKNILIIGTPRCGKSTISNQLFQRNKNYELVRGDIFSLALGILYRRKKFSKMKPKNGILELDFKEINLSDEVITEVFYEMIAQMKIDLRKANRKMIFETHEISIENAKKQFEPLGFDIYCMGMPNENVEHLMKQIRKNDDNSDWTRGIGSVRLEFICNYIINQSKKNAEECKKYNIKFFDTSGKREEKMDKIIKIIEEKSINS